MKIKLKMIIIFIVRIVKVSLGDSGVLIVGVSLFLVRSRTRGELGTSFLMRVKVSIWSSYSINFRRFVRSVDCVWFFRTT